MCKEDMLPAEFRAAQGEAGLDRVERGQDERDMTLVAHLKSKVQALDFCQLSRRLGTDWSADNPDLLSFSYLGRSILLGRDEVVMDGEQLVDPRDQILLYNYVAFGGNASGGAEERLPDGTWVGMESLPNSIAKIRTLATYCEGRLAERFAGRIKEFTPLCDKVGGKEVMMNKGRVQILLLFFLFFPAYPCTFYFGIRMWKTDLRPE